MVSTPHHVSILLSGIICGMILFQSAIVAPIVFKNLDGENAKVFLRSLFPKLFITCAFLGLISLLQIVVWGEPSNASYIVTLITIIAMGVCYTIVPATNRARDAGDHQRFARFHKVSVYLTMLVLIANLGWIYI